MKLDDLRKLELSSIGRLSSLPDDTVVNAIVKVREPSYVPEGLTVRARIDEMMFTATCRAGTLRRLEADPRVESFALAERIEPVDRG